MNTPLLLSVIGARPEIIQATPLSKALSGRVDEVLVHTGQHYDAAMSGDQILDTGLPQPALNLEVGSLPDLEQLAVSEKRLGEAIEQIGPDAVLVRGDTNATLAAARAAVARELPLLHVEAGLRSWRTDMPEERNRVQTDRLADTLFAPTESARANLEAEEVQGTVHVTGDPLCDMLLGWAPRLPPSPVDGEYVLATVHRNYNTDDPDRLQLVLNCLGASPWPVVFPVHPRTRTKIENGGLDVPPAVSLQDPVTYSVMLALERSAQAVATDSGGVQREAYVWGVPCVTLREETEWIETVQTGWNTLVGADAHAFAAALALERPSEHPPVFGDGRASEKIAQLTVERLEALLSAHA